MKLKYVGEDNKSGLVKNDLYLCKIVSANETGNFLLRIRNHKKKPLYVDLSYTGLGSMFKEWTIPEVVSGTRYTNTSRTVTIPDGLTSNILYPIGGYLYDIK